jgi:hypothetical protein
MDPLRETGKLLLVFGGVLVVVGLLLSFGPKLPFRLGRLPGDIVYQGRNTTFYFPIVTCIVISVVLSLVMWMIGQIRK